MNEKTGELKKLDRIMYENGDYSFLFPQGVPPPPDTLPLPEDTTLLPQPPDVDPGEPLFWDWRNVNGVNYLNGIREQGNCGSCYAFAATAVAEAAYYRATNIKIDLSEAFIAFNGQCSYPNDIAGCMGLYNFGGAAMIPLKMYCQEGGVFNTVGLQKKYKQTKDKKYKLEVADLDVGIYYLKVKVKSKDGSPTILEDRIVISR